VKAKRLTISFGLLREILKSGAHPGGYTVERDAVPADAQLLNVRHNVSHGWPNAIEILITSETFAALAPGEVIPEITPVVTRTIEGAR
jgi:hypothetical protein